MSTNDFLTVSLQTYDDQSGMCKNTQDVWQNHFSPNAPTQTIQKPLLKWMILTPLQKQEQRNVEL